MAKKKAHKKTHTYRRRKVGALKTDFAEPLAVLGGVVAGRLLTKIMPSSISAKTQPIITTAIGAAGFMFLKSSTAKYVASGIFASGGLQLIQSFGVLNGFKPKQSAPYVVGAGRGYKRMNYSAPVRRIAGASGRQPASLAPMVVGAMC